MKLTEISSQLPIVISLVDKLTEKNIKVFYDHHQLGLCQIERIDAVKRGGRYDVIYAYPGEDPHDRNTATESFSATPEQLWAAKLVKWDDGSFLLQVPPPSQAPA